MKEATPISYLHTCYIEYKVYSTLQKGQALLIQFHTIVVAWKLDKVKTTANRAVEWHGLEFKLPSYNACRLELLP